MNFKNTYYEQFYKCASGHISKHYVWSNDLKKSKHTCSCGLKLTNINIHQKSIVQVAGIRTDTKNRV